MNQRAVFKRWLGSALALLSAASLSAETITFEELPTPSAPGSAHAHLSRALDGAIYLSWVERGEGASLRFARFDVEADAWGEAHTIASGSGWMLNVHDTPTLAAGMRGRLAAVWYVANSTAGAHAMVSTSLDRGKTWSPPRRLTDESDQQEFVKLTPLLSGSWLATWLDGRAFQETGNTQLRSRELNSSLPDALVDERVCDCCSLDTLLLPNGRVLLAYRDRSDDEIRDITYLSYRRDGWQPASAPTADGWRIAGCPVNGPSLSRRSGNLLAAWFTGVNDTAQVLVARSNNLGRTWNQVVRLDDPEVPARGSLGSFVLRNGSRWVGWLETTGDYALRPLRGDGSRGSISRFTGAGTDGAQPRLALLDNRSGQAARILVATTQDERVTTHLGTLPYDPDTDENDCGCGPGTPAASRGHAVEGKIVSLLPEQNALLVAHQEVPGVMRAMTMSFQVDRRTFDQVKPGQHIAGRMEQRADGRWWLFAIRILAPTD
jgi:hypothetical protein